MASFWAVLLLPIIDCYQMVNFTHSLSNLTQLLSNLPRMPYSPESPLLEAISYPSHAETSAPAPRWVEKRIGNHLRNLYQVCFDKY